MSDLRETRRELRAFVRRMAEVSACVSPRGVALRACVTPDVAGRVLQDLVARGVLVRTARGRYVAIGRAE